VKKECKYVKINSYVPRSLSEGTVKQITRFSPLHLSLHSDAASTCPMALSSLLHYLHIRMPAGRDTPQ
jgi:hypothetical protein